MVEPLVVDLGDAIARAIDHVYEVLAAVRFAQPMPERNLGLVPRRAQRRERPFEVARPDEHVKVLGVVLDARVAGEGIRAADQNVEVGFLERAQRRAIERPGSGFENLQLRLGSGHIVASRVARDVPTARRASCCLRAR